MSENNEVEKLDDEELDDVAGGKFLVKLERAASTGTR